MQNSDRVEPDVADTGEQSDATVELAEQLHDYLRGDDASFLEVWLEFLVSLLSDAFNLLGQGFLFVLSCGIVFMVGQKAFSSLSRSIK